MADIIDIKTKKEYKPTEVGYYERTKKCYDIYLKTGKPCDCQTCKDKRFIIQRLINISNYLCLDQMQKTGNPLYYGDWYEIVLAAAIKVGDVVYPHL